MEYKNDKDYQVVEATIAVLESKLKDLQKLQFQDINLLKTQVKEHFQECIGILHDRMISLLNQLTDMSQQQDTIKTEIERVKESLCGYIQGGKDLLDNGVNMYKTHPTIAAHIWRGAQLIEVPAYSKEQFNCEIAITLNSSILDTLHSHGTVINQHPTALNKSLSSDDDIQNIETQLKRLNTFDLTANSELTNPSSHSRISSSMHSSLSTSPISFSSESPSSITSPQLPTVQKSSLFQEMLKKGKTLEVKKEYFAEVDTVTTFAGEARDLKDGNAKNAKFARPLGICHNPNDDCFYVCDKLSDCIRKIDQQGNVTTFVKVEAMNSRSIVVYHKENTFFVSCDTAVLRITSSGNITVFAGDVSHSGTRDGSGASARFNRVQGITIDQKTGTIYVCEWNDDGIIRKITREVQVTTLVSKSTSGIKRDMRTEGICFVEEDDSILFSDVFNNRVLQYLKGRVSSVCELEYPQCIGLLGSGKIMVTTSKSIAILQRQGPKEYTVRKTIRVNDQMIDGNANECSFHSPYGIAVHTPSNSCFVTEHNVDVIRRISFL